MKNTEDNVSRETESQSLLCRSSWVQSHFLLDKNSGQVAEINCKSWRCPKHQHSWKHKWQTVLTRDLALKPVDRLVTLTCASKATADQLVAARRSLCRDLRTLNGPFEYFSVLEFTSKSRLPHMHMLVRGVYIDHWELSCLWEIASVRAGFKRSYITYIEKPRSQTGSAHYALKYALSGAEKDQSIPDDWEGRKITYSKNFFQKTVKVHWKEYITEFFGPPDPDATWVRRAEFGRESNEGQPYIAELTDCDIIDKSYG